MRHNFDIPPVRRDTDSLKWQRYGDALPLWVADMDFLSPEPVLAALQERVFPLQHPIKLESLYQQLMNHQFLLMVPLNQHVNH